MKSDSGVCERLFAQWLIASIACCRLGDILTHGSISFDVLHPIIIHDAQVAVTECFCHGFRYFGFRLDHLGECFLSFSLHLQFAGHGHCTAFLSFGLADILVGICLVYLQSRTDVLTYIDISDINGQDFESRTGIQTFAEHKFGD